MEPKSVQNRSQQQRRNPSETALAPESPPRPTWTSFWPSFGPLGPHFFDTSTFNHSLETKRVPKSTPKRSNSNKQHITKITIESIPKFIDLGIQKRAQNDAKTEPGDDRAMALIFLGAKVVPRVASRTHLDLMLGLFWATWASFLRKNTRLSHAFC